MSYLTIATTTGAQSPRRVDFADFARLFSEGEEEPVIVTKAGLVSRVAARLTTMVTALKPTVTGHFGTRNPIVATAASS